MYCNIILHCTHRFKGLFYNVVAIRLLLAVEIKKKPSIASAL